MKRPLTRQQLKAIFAKKAYPVQEFYRERYLKGKKGEPKPLEIVKLKKGWTVVVRRPEEGTFGAEFRYRRDAVRLKRDILKEGFLPHRRYFSRMSIKDFEEDPPREILTRFRRLKYRLFGEEVSRIPIYRIRR